MGNNKEIQRQQYNRTVAMLKQYRDAQFFLQHTTDEESKQRTEAAEQHITSGREERIVEIISFIQKNYVDVTLDMLVDTFHLSKPYLSKYIKEKAGMTFQEVVREERMKKARMLLKETNQTVETIAANVGYENVEHFNRLFKKAYDMTPVQYRKQSAE